MKVTRPASAVGQPSPDGRPREPDASPSRLRGIPPLSRLTGAQLTGAERKLAEVLSRRYPEAALLSARNMADAAGTSPASVTRFARKLGYADFAELQAELAVEMRARLNSPPKRLSVDAQGRRRPAGSLLRDVIARERENLDATVNMIDEGQLEALARRLADNRKALVYVAGSKKAGVVASYFAIQLAQLRPGVRLLSLSDALPDELLDMCATDLLVVFEPRRATAILVRLLTEARAAGAQVAAFTDEHPPDVIASSDFLFRTKVDAISVFDSYAAMFALCDALLAAIVQHVPNAVRTRAERLESLNARFTTWHRQQGAEIVSLRRFFSLISMNPTRRTRAPRAPGPRRAAAALLVTVALAAAGCGGSGSASSGSANSILTIGTTNYIDTLNPFVGIEPQDDTAYSMVFPQLVQYGPGLKLVGDWAQSWTESPDGLVWTFHLHGGGKWSDGVPLTARDAVWTIDTVLKYASGPTAYFAGLLDGVKSASAPNADTLVLTYSHPVAPVLANLEQFYVLPEHVWDKHTGDNGADLKTFFPEQHLPMVSGGPYTITQFQEKGTTVFRPNAYFYGPKSHAAAVALTYYTNPTSMLADLEAGRLDFVDDVPYQDASPLEGVKGITVTIQPGEEVTNLGFNSNPAKPKNRELLNPVVREALEYAIPRQQIINTVFGGHAVPWADILSEWSGPSGWLNPAVKPLPYDPAKADQILNSLGYARGPGGVRVVPATHGAFAQPAHPMSYTVIVPDDLDFDGNLQFLILQTAFAKIGVKITEIPGGDGTQAYTLITAPNGTYKTTDMYTWYWHPYIDPNFNLSVVTTAQWNDNSDTGMSNPMYNTWWNEQSSMVNVAQRRALVWKMEAYLAQQRPYIQLVDADLITAHADTWAGFQPDLWTFCKCYYTSPYPVS